MNPADLLNLTGKTAIVTGGGNGNGIGRASSRISQWVSGQVLFVNGGGEQTLD